MDDRVRRFTKRNQMSVGDKGYWDNINDSDIDMMNKKMGMDKVCVTCKKNLFYGGCGFMNCKALNDFKKQYKTPEK